MGFFASHGDRTYTPAELPKEFAFPTAPHIEHRFRGLRDLIASALL